MREIEEIEEVEEVEEIGGEMTGETTATDGIPERRTVTADLLESTPNALGYWLLASPLILFLLWVWLDLFAHYSPLPRPVDWVIGVAIFALFFILPLGYLAHRLVTSLPRLFHHAGWDLEPLEPISEREMYLVRYRYGDKYRAPNSWRRAWVRAAQGWVYLEIMSIFAGAILMIPIFFSVSEFGFGR